MLYRKLNTRGYINFKIWHTLLPYDVINDVMNICLDKCGHNLMIPMHRKFNDDISARFLVIMKNVAISFIREGRYRGPISGPPCDVIGWRPHHENYFLWHNLDDLFISEVKLKLYSIFQNFENGRHLELATNFFTGSDTGSWIYTKDSHQHFRYFEILIDALAQILTEIY